MTDYQTQAAMVVALIAAAGPVTGYVVELAKAVGLKGKPATRVAAAIVAAVATLGVVSLGDVEWRAAPVVWLIAWGLSEAGHRIRNANEAGPPNPVPPTG